MVMRHGIIARRHEEHRDPDLRRRLQHGGHRARGRSATTGARRYGAQVARRDQQPRRCRRPGVRARAAASPTEVVDHKAFRQPRSLRRRAGRRDRPRTSRRWWCWPASCASSRRASWRATQGRLLNIHPSLLPAFPGLHTHQRAIEAGCRFAGATVHQVTAELDHGPILDQAVVPVLPGDTARHAGRARADAGAPASIRAPSRALLADPLRPMHPKALLDACADLVGAGPEVRPPRRRRGVALFPRAPLARPARARHAGRDRLRRAAPQAAVRAPRRAPAAARASGGWPSWASPGRATS